MSDQGWLPSIRFRTAASAKSSAELSDVDDQQQTRKAETTRQQNAVLAGAGRPGDRLSRAGVDDTDAGAAPDADGAGPSKKPRPNVPDDGFEKRADGMADSLGIPVGAPRDGGEEKKDTVPPVISVEDRALRDVLHNEDIPKSLSNLYLFWIGLESNVTEPITLPSTTVFAASKKAFEDAKTTVRFGSAPYDEIYIWLMGEEMIPKQLCATVRSVLNTIEQRRTLLRARRIPFWDLFVGQDAVFLSKWITAQHLYNVQSNRSWSGRRENHQALAQITRDAAEYFCTRP